MMSSMIWLHRTRLTSYNQLNGAYHVAAAPTGPCLSDRTPARGRCNPRRAGERLHARQGRRTDLPPSLAERSGVHEAAAGLHLDAASPRGRREPDLSELYGLGLNS